MQGPIEASEQVIAMGEVELNKGYIVTVGDRDNPEEIHNEVRGILRSTTTGLEGMRCWRLEGTFIHHLIPMRYILEVRKENRRFVW